MYFWRLNINILFPGGLTFVLVLFEAADTQIRRPVGSLFLPTPKARQIRRSAREKRGCHELNA